MRLHIRHRLVFTYEAPIFLEPMTVRLRPRADATQLVQAYDLDVDPPPAGRTDAVDACGNAVTFLWFEGLQEELRLESRSTVQTCRENPFDFIILDDVSRSIPLSYPAAEAAVLAPYLSRPAASPEVDALAAAVADEAGHQTLPVLTRLAERLASGFPAQSRRRGDAWPPARTLAEGGGACRDLAVLHVDCLRALGLAARFVSGYAVDAAAGGTRQLHAWAEVYVPGGGWRGWDPTLGLATGARHVPVAAAPEAPGAAPTRGTYRGESSGRMAFELEVEPIE